MVCIIHIELARTAIMDLVSIIHIVELARAVSDMDMVRTVSGMVVMVMVDMDMVVMDYLFNQ